MIRTENCPDIHILLQTPLYIESCVAKFDWARGYMLNLAGKYLVTGHYHKPCIIRGIGAKLEVVRQNSRPTVVKVCDHNRKYL